MREFLKHNWLILLISLGILILFVFAIIIPQFKIFIEATKKEMAKPDIAIAHIDKGGTIWINVDGNEYYLYIDDNGTPKRLEMR